MKINITGVSGSRVAYYAAKEIVKKKKTMLRQGSRTIFLFLYRTEKSL